MKNVKGKIIEADWSNFLLDAIKLMDITRGSNFLLDALKLMDITRCLRTAHSVALNPRTNYTD
jgi:hypothetical protein